VLLELVRSQVEDDVLAVSADYVLCGADVVVEDDELPKGSVRFSNVRIGKWIDWVVAWAPGLLMVERLNWGLAWWLA